MTAIARPKKSEFRCLYPIVTRWSDNDIYGHINNVVYYSYFDSVVNRYLVEEGQLDIHQSEVVAYVVNSQCQYFSPLAYPQDVEVGLRVGKLGNSSVIYELGVFAKNQDEASAFGSFVHVFVDRKTDQSTPIPETIRGALAKLV